MGLLHLLVLLARHPGLAVVVSEPVPSRRRLALELGAAAACPPGPALNDAVRKRTGLRGADAAFDTVGGSKVLGGLLGVLRPGGTVVLFAHGRSGESAGFELNPFFKSEQRVVGTYSGGLAEQEEAFSLLESGRLDPRPLISHRLSFGDFALGVRLARRREALKVLLEPDHP